MKKLDNNMVENKPTIWEKALNLLEKGEPVVMFIVTESKGSSPGKAGFKMIVTKDGQSFGSTGGGKSEYEFITLAKSLIEGDKMSIHLIEKTHHSQDGENNESICGGSQSQIVLPLTEKYIPLIKSIIKATDNKNGIIKVDSCGLHLFDDIPPESDYLFHKENDYTWSYEEKITQLKKVYIIGGGHVGMAISRIMKFLKFQVIVLDNRPDLTLMDQNTYADKKMIVNYDDIANHVPEGEYHLVIIATHAHKNDQNVLQKLINNKYGYLGMLGSKAKVKQVFSNLKEQGISDEPLAKVHAPIGLPINSKTPEEIAVSIAGQIIKLGI